MRLWQSKPIWLNSDSFLPNNNVNPSISYYIYKAAFLYNKPKLLRRFSPRGFLFSEQESYPTLGRKDIAKSRDGIDTVSERWYIILTDTVSGCGAPGAERERVPKAAARRKERLCPKDQRSWKRPGARRSWTRASGFTPR